MTIPAEKIKMLSFAKTVIEKQGTVTIVAYGMQFEATSIQFTQISRLVEARLSDGRTISFDANDAFALIRDS